jgi:hypothetical protein
VNTVHAGRISALAAAVARVAHHHRPQHTRTPTHTQVGVLALEKIRKEAKQDYAANRKASKGAMKHKHVFAVAAVQGAVHDAWSG